MRSVLCGAVFIVGCAVNFGVAQAQEPVEDPVAEPELRELINCQPGKSFAKLANGLGGLDADRLDTINTKPSFEFQVLDGGPLPSRIFHRSSSGEETDLPFSQDGEVTDFVALFLDGEKDEFCVEDRSRAGKPKGDADTYQVALRLNMNFINRSGTYTMAELIDGSKDGKIALKKIIGGAKAMFVPNLTHIHVTYKDQSTTPDIQGCTKDGVCTALEFEVLNGNYLFPLKALEEMDATELRVGGGVHKLSPSVDFETLSKRMNGEKGKDK